MNGLLDDTVFHHTALHRLPHRLHPDILRTSSSSSLFTRPRYIPPGQQSTDTAYDPADRILLILSYLEHHTCSKRNHHTLFISSDCYIFSPCSSTLFLPSLFCSPPFPAPTPSDQATTTEVSNLDMRHTYPPTNGLLPLPPMLLQVSRSVNDEFPRERKVLMLPTRPRHCPRGHTRVREPRSTLLVSLSRTRIQASFITDHRGPSPIFLPRACPLPGLGACGQYNHEPDFVVALNSAQYGGGYPGPECFKYITITGGSRNGYAVAQIVDE